MIRMAFNVACIAGVLVGGVRGSGTEPPQEAKAKIAQCIEREGDEYVEARNWLIEHPEALDLLGEQSWKESWLKKICQGWIEQKALYEREMKTFEIGEMHARRSVSVGVPGPLHWAEGASRTHGDKDVPLMVECLWKTGRNWRRYKAWRMYAVVEYLKRHGDASILDPAIESLVSQSWNSKPAPDPGSEYPRMSRFTTASAHTADQLAPYTPVKLIVEFGDEDTLRKLRTFREKPQTSDRSKKVLQRSIELLERRLDRKMRGEPVEKVDLAVEFGDHRTLENLKVWDEIHGNEAFKQKTRDRAARLEKRLQEEKESNETK